MNLFELINTCIHSVQVSDLLLNQSYYLSYSLFHNTIKYIMNHFLILISLTYSLIHSHLIIQNNQTNSKLILFFFLHVLHNEQIIFLYFAVVFAHIINNIFYVFIHIEHTLTKRIFHNYGFLFQQKKASLSLTLPFSNFFLI
jgi:hypothetical protein